MTLIWFKFSSPVKYEDYWLDSPLTIDPSLESKEALLSDRIVEPSSEEKLAPVCVLVHGFSASSAEFNSFKKIAKEMNPSILFSTVVMGGHGRDYQSFKDATYSDWATPIINEVTTLKSKGYQNISILGVSGGGATTLHAVLMDQIIDINQLILLDPYIVPKNKLIFWVPVLRLFIKNTTSGATRDIEYKRKYYNRPASALNELRLLVINVQDQLKSQSNKNLPDIHVFTANGDPSSDTLGADFIKRYIPETSIHRYNSDRHVIIDPDTKLDWTNNDQELMMTVIRQIIQVIQN